MLPVSPFSSCDAPGYSRRGHPHPEGNLVAYLDPRLADGLRLSVCMVIVERLDHGIPGCRCLRHSIPRMLL